MKPSLSGCKEKELGWVFSAWASWAAIQGPARAPFQELGPTILPILRPISNTHIERLV